MSGWYELMAEALVKERTHLAEERYAELQALKECREHDTETHNLIADVERWLKRRRAKKTREKETEAEKELS